ncbi:MAG: PIN domain-containing protein [Selenomonadaceae bacterium]|nr:PIN domain-containing protein [Selenomonadaceae bacterium]
MVLLIDANVVIDYIMIRKPQYDDAIKLIDYCRKFKVKTYVAFHSVSIIWYILRKNFPPQERRPILLSITDLLTVTAAPHESVVDAINSEDFPDFEDCLQEKCALEVDADYIVTGNVKDFETSQVKAVTPAEMLEIIFNS